MSTFTAMESGNTFASDCDVAVIGAGPAGAAAAIVCSLAGLRTLVLDRMSAPRERPGESLHPGAEAIFRQLGVWDQVKEAKFPVYTGIKVVLGESSQFIPFGSDASGPWTGLQAWGGELDEILLKRAVETGAKAARPCHASLISKHVRGWGLSTSTGLASARFVLDAGGGSHWLARRLNLRVHRISPPLIACYGYYSSQIEDGVPTFHERPNGWLWHARVRPNIQHWSALSFDKAQPPLPPPDFEGGAVRHADVTWRFVSACAGSGYFLVGDAAAVIDPAASHGILRAMMSGVLAGQLIVNLTRGEISSETAIGCYREWLLGWFLRDAAELARRYGRFAGAPSWAKEVELNCRALSGCLRTTKEISPLC